MNLRYAMTRRHPPLSCWTEGEDTASRIKETVR